MCLPVAPHSHVYVSVERVSILHPADWSVPLWKADRCFGSPTEHPPWHCAAVLVGVTRTAVLPLIPGDRPSMRHSRPITENMGTRLAWYLPQAAISGPVQQRAGLVINSTFHYAGLKSCLIVKERLRYFRDFPGAIKNPRLAAPTGGSLFRKVSAIDDTFPQVILLKASGHTCFILVSEKGGDRFYLIRQIRWRHGDTGKP